MDKTFLIFGDSITYGAADKAGGWVNRLREFLDGKNSQDNSFHRVFNLGIAGNKTADVLKRFVFEAEQRLREDAETIIIFAIGINDSQFLGNQDLLAVSVEDFEGNIKKLAGLAKKFSSKIIFIGFTPVEESKTTPIPWDTNKSYKNEYIQKYNKIINSVCKENEIGFVEIFSQWTQTNYGRLLCEDGLHPNSEGHKKIFEIVKDYLEEKDII